jgi:hypothetical protein
MSEIKKKGSIVVPQLHLYLTYFGPLFVVHAGGLLGRGVDPHGGNTDGPARRAEDEGGDGALGGAWNRLHRGAHPVDGHEQGEARRAVSG